jgi:RNA polymerase subunit RPABC4/transcription elongation factor Spt4
LVGAWFGFIVGVVVIIDPAPGSHLAGASWFGFIVIIDPAPSVVVARLAYIVGERI